MSAWPIDDDTAEPEPLRCPGCDAVGEDACAPGCRYEARGPSGESEAEWMGRIRDDWEMANLVAATLADVYHDEQASSDADPPDPWEDIF